MLLVSLNLVSKMSQSKAELITSGNESQAVIVKLYRGRTRSYVHRWSTWTSWNTYSELFCDVMCSQVSKLYTIYTWNFNDIGNQRQGIFPPNQKKVWLFSHKMGQILGFHNVTIILLFVFVKSFFHDIKMMTKILHVVFSTWF